MNLDDSLRDNCFDDTAQLAQGLKFALRRGKNWEAMGPESKEALELIATEIAKILTEVGDEAQQWNNIAFFARIRGKALEGSLEKTIAQTAQARVINPKNLFDPPIRVPVTHEAS
jgi:hypothetical protein